MPVPDLIKEGERQMMICNACRYCEGYCAVFPAMEQRRMFTKADLVYLANLCFDCRDCYYACQHAPPHEFGVNIPKLMAELRTETYREHSWPAILSGLLRRNGLAVSLITGGATLVVFILVLLFMGPVVLTATHLGEGSFYRVVPYVAMTIPPILIALYGLVVFTVGAVFNQFDWNATADFRDTSAMGMLLVIHLGVVAGFFLTAPYGKFAHVVYRYAALVRYSIEQQRN